MSKNVLVTGGAGYIGSHTVVSLVENGFTPIIVDDFRNSYESVIDGIEKIIGFRPIYVSADACDKASLKSVFEKYPIHGVIHFAADKAVGESVANPLKYYRNNILGLVTVLETVCEFNVKNVVFSSSCTVYGEPKGQKEVTEETPKNLPNSPYGFTKWMGEQIIDDTFVSDSSLKLIKLRYFNPVGAHKSALIGELPIGRPNNLLPFITQTAIGKQESLTVFGDNYPTPDGTCIRDYIHVMDLAEAHVKAITYMDSQENGLCDTINIGTGKGSSVLEIIKAFEENCDAKLNWNFGPRRAGDVTEIFANASKADKLLNWKAKLTIADAVIDAWRWEQRLANEN